MNEAERDGAMARGQVGEAIARVARAVRPEEGWRAYEWRFRIGHAGTSLRPFATNPLWRGEPAAGRTLRLRAEQGLLDTRRLAEATS